MRDVGLAVVGIGGAVSTPLTQLAELLPLGPAPFRAAAVSAVALGLCSWLIARITARLLVATAVSPRLTYVLSTVAAMMATLSISWQREATVGGGACVAAALALLMVDVAMRSTDPEASTLVPAATKRWLQMALLAGATMAESLPAGVAAMFVVVLMALTAGKRPPVRLMPSLAVCALATMLVLSVPQVLRPLAPRSWSDVGHGLSAVQLHTLDTHTTRVAALHAWATEVGVISLVLAAMGLALGLWRSTRRAWMGALVGFVLVDLLYPLAAAPSLAPEPLAPLRTLAVVAIAVAAALGVAEAVKFLRELEVPMARAASVLTVVFHITIAAVACEEAAYAADYSERFGAEEWTDEALEQLPHRAAVLVHSTSLAWRLWNAQTLAGQRPDVLIVPAPLLKHGSVTNNLVPSAPAVSQLLRDFALSGQASEYGLSLLADERPLLLELDDRWDKRVMSHITVAGPWLSYAPTVLGRSDRQPGPHVLTPRIAVSLGSVTERQATALVVTRTLKEHTAAMTLLGMGEHAPPLIDSVERLAPADPFVTSARLRLAHAERRQRLQRPVELRDLLRF